MFNEDDVEMAYCSRDGQIRDALSEADIDFYPLRKLSVSEVRRVIKTYKPDIVHAHDAAASVVASLSGFKQDIVSHMHVNHESMSKVNLRTVLLLLSSVRFKHIYWVSKSSYDTYLFKNIISRKSSILYNVMNRNAILDRVEQDHESYDYDVVYIGRLTYQKNPQRLIKVFKLALDLNPDMKIAIIGTGDLMDEAMTISQIAGIQKKLSFLGFKSNPLKILHDAKVMTMTSRFEGTPMCALEAMAVGVPIVTTPTDGLVDLLTDGSEGYLSDDDEILAHRIVDIVTDHDLHDRLSGNIVKKFVSLNDLKEYKKEIWSIYSAILG